MICPYCKNKGWNKDNELKNPVIQIRGPEHYDHGTYRLHTCINCNRSFESVQKFNRDIKNRKDQMELFHVKRALGNG